MTDWMLSPLFGFFLLAALLLAISPGPGMAYVLARTVAGGRAAGLASTAGTALGGLVHVFAAALGLSALLAQSASALTLVRYAGAAYLIYLGLRMLRARPAPGPVEGAALPAAGLRRAFAEGVVVEAVNVKTALFFLAFLPQFVDPALPLAGQFVVLGLCCVTLNSAADAVVVWGASAALARWSARPRAHRWLQHGSGAALVALGVGVAVARVER